ncbi:calcium-binding protein [Nonomuraea longicatena]|uniref:calcium-binding protein n=1 Tax=Nonomuraea longicatena TaxID=83682 RepID=UPI0031E23283
MNAGGNWAPVTPGKWQFPGDQVILAQAGVARPGPRRPFEYAVLRTGPEFASVEIEAQVRLDTPTSVNNRDVIIVFGYRSDTRFYYVHLSQDNTIYPHNGIFVVDNADRLRLDHQWNGQVGAPPAVTDAAWHRVRLTHCVPTGEIAVYMDGSATPLMTATDRRLGSGRVGFGSFDNIGRMRDMKVTGTPICAGQAATVTGTPGGDVLTGTQGNDVIAALGGDDLVRSLGGDDVVCAGDGRDVVLAGDGDDRVLGEAGRDLLNGQNGDDSLYGGADPDLLNGGPGDDRLYGTGPDDVLVGGPGRDTSHTDHDQTPTPRSDPNAEPRTPTPEDRNPGGTRRG